MAIFCLATYGEGEPTDNAREFYDWLKAAEESKNVDLSGLSYTVRLHLPPSFSHPSRVLSSHLFLLFPSLAADNKVFGLGNKTYEQFNFVARGVDAALQALGAKRVFERGEGDDDAKYIINSSSCASLAWLLKHANILLTQ